MNYDVLAAVLVVVFGVVVTVKFILISLEKEEQLWREKIGI